MLHREKTRPADSACDARNRMRSKTTTSARRDALRVAFDSKASKSFFKFLKIYDFASGIHDFHIAPILDFDFSAAESLGMRDRTA